MTKFEGSHVHGLVWPAAVVVCGGSMMDCLEMGMLTRILDGVVLGGRLRGAGGRWGEGRSGCGGWGVLVWVGAPVRAGSLVLRL